MSPGTHLADLVVVSRQKCQCLVAEVDGGYVAVEQVTRVVEINVMDGFVQTVANFVHMSICSSQRDLSSATNAITSLL
jgi:hypothetical protein